LMVLVVAILAEVAREAPGVMVVVVIADALVVVGAEDAHKGNTYQQLS
jgi:hypothetical protein